MLPKIRPEVLEVYNPVSIWESFYLRARWRLCPYESVETLVPKSGKILDLGCGYGMLANLIALKSPSRSVIGIDLNDRRIRTAKRSINDRNNIVFHCLALESIEVSTYDAVVMTDVLHHIDDETVTKLLKTITSLLSDNGVLVILDVDRAPFWKFFITYFIDRLLNPLSQLNYRSIGALRRLIEQFPLNNEKIIQSHKGLPLSDVIYRYRKNLP